MRPGSDHEGRDGSDRGRSIIVYTLRFTKRKHKNLSNVHLNKKQLRTLLRRKGNASAAVPANTAATIHSLFAINEIGASGGIEQIQIWEIINAHRIAC